MTRRPLWVDIVILVGAAGLFLAMIALGNWQIERLAWKRDLIAAVETRAFEPEVAAPTSSVSPEDDVYRRVSASGRFLHDKTRRVKALTELGGGHWVMTPLDTGADILWVNRGFVPSGTGPADWTRPEGPIDVTGLIRITEPNGTLLERNAPEEERWVSRDIEALSAAAGISNAWSYFLDADHLGPEDTWPRGGLTKLTFRNTHLSYALTWYAMAAGFLGAMAYVIWDRRRDR